MARIKGRRKTHWVGRAISIEIDEIETRLGDDQTFGLMQNFVRTGDVVKHGTAFDGLANPKYAHVDQLKTNFSNITPNEPGSHTLVVVFFDKFGDDYRFFQYVFEELDVERRGS